MDEGSESTHVALRKIEIRDKTYRSGLSVRFWAGIMAKMQSPNERLTCANDVFYD